MWQKDVQKHIILTNTGK